MNGSHARRCSSFLSSKSATLPPAGLSQNTCLAGWSLVLTAWFTSVVFSPAILFHRIASVLDGQLTGRVCSRQPTSHSFFALSQVDESDYRATSARTLHSLTALSGEVGGLRGDVRVDVDRLSSRLLAKVGLVGTEK